jgi:phage FluMu protein Com
LSAALTVITEYLNADYADVEIKCPVCRKVFEVKLEKKAG